MSNMRGQVEFIIIVGLIIVSAVVIIYALRGGLPIIPGGPDQEKALVESSVESFIFTSAAETIRTVSSQGGYLDKDFAQGSVKLSGDEIPYWQLGSNIVMPDIKTNLETGIKNYITQNKDALASSFSKTVVIGEPKVSVNILNNKVVVTVNMPTTLQIDDTSYPIRQPYEVSVPTKLGEMTEFATNFARSQASERYFEYFTLSTMDLSPIENGEKTIPMGSITLTECGESYYSSWNRIKPHMEFAIKSTLAHIYMPEKVPLNIITLTSHPKYSLPALNGKKYSDLTVSFHTPDNFQFDRSTLQISPDTISLVTKPIPFAGFCQSDSVYVTYFIEYPVVTRVTDQLTGNTFQFAGQAYIYNNLPGDFGNITRYDSDLSRLCSNPLCSASVKVKDSQGLPVKGASVTFMGCSLGNTDTGGLLTAPSPCGLGVLRIDHDNFEEYEQMKSTSNGFGANELENLEVFLAKKKAVNLHFYEVIIEDFGSQYRIPFGGINPLEDKFVRLEFAQAGKEKTYPTVLTEQQSFTLTDIPEGNYILSASLESTDSLKIFGAVGTVYTLGDKSDLYIYLPNYLPFNDVTNTTERLLAAFTLTNVLKNCMGGPVLTSEYEQTQMLTCGG